MLISWNYCITWCIKRVVQNLRQRTQTQYFNHVNIVNTLCNIILILQVDSLSVMPPVFDRLNYWHWNNHMTTPSAGLVTPGPWSNWGRDKMVVILRTTYSNAFSWMNIYEFWLRFHWGSNLQYTSIGSYNGVALARRQAVIWTNDR